MATNAKTDDKADDPIAAKVTEDDLRKDFEKAEVEAKAEANADEPTDETPDEAEAGKEDGQTDDQAEGKEESEPEFVKQVPSITGDTQEEYLKNLEVAYQNSTTEALRLKGLADAAETPEDEIDLSDPLRLYAKQKMDEDINKAFTEFSKDYPQVSDQAEYNKFTVEVGALSNTIMTSQKRLASPEELYSKAAIILGWNKDTADSKDKLNMAIKDGAATPKVNSAKAKPEKSKISDAVLKLNKEMYPNKTEDEIRKELEPYIK